MVAKNVAKSNLTYVSAKPGEKEIIVTHLFEAPPELVFRAYTDPDLIPQWWGPEGYITKVDRMDLKQGGVWRFIQYGPEGDEYAFSGVYREIIPSEKLAYTFNFEAVPGHEALETLIFEKQDGKTRLTDKFLFLTVEERDGMLSSGMEEGASETMNLLTELLEKMKKRQ